MSTVHPAASVAWLSAHERGLANWKAAVDKCGDYFRAPTQGHRLILFYAARDCIESAASTVDRDTLLSLAASRMQKPSKGADRRRSDSAPRALRELIAEGVLYVRPSADDPDRIAITFDDRFEPEDDEDVE